MQHSRLARHLILNGTVVAILLAISFYPMTLMSVVWEVATARLHPIATVARVVYCSAIVAVGFVAWKRGDLKLAIVFLAMLGAAACIVALVHWRW